MRRLSTLMIMIWRVLKMALVCSFVSFFVVLSQGDSAEGNQPPFFIKPPTLLYVPKEAKIGHEVIILEANDPDDSSLTFRISIESTNILDNNSNNIINDIFSIEQLSPKSAKIVLSKDLSALKVDQLKVIFSVTDGSNVQIEHPCIIFLVTSNNSPPTITNLPSTINISENSELNKQVFKVRASDKFTIVKFKLEPKSPDFKINEITGDITIIKLLNYHTKRAYNLTVVATNDRGISSSQPISIQISINRNIPPYFLLPFFEANLLENITTNTYILRVQAYNGLTNSKDGVVYEIVSDTLDILEINKSSGRLSTKRTFDCTERLLYATNCTYTAAVQACSKRTKDSGNNCSTALIRIQITDLNNFQISLTSERYNCYVIYDSENAAQDVVSLCEPGVEVTKSLGSTADYELVLINVDTLFDWTTVFDLDLTTKNGLVVKSKTALRNLKATSTTMKVQLKSQMAKVSTETGIINIRIYDTNNKTIKNDDNNNNRRDIPFYEKKEYSISVDLDNLDFKKAILTTKLENSDLYSEEIRYKVHGPQSRLFTLDTRTGKLYSSERLKNLTNAILTTKATTCLTSQIFIVIVASLSSTSTSSEKSSVSLSSDSKSVSAFTFVKINLTSNKIIFCDNNRTNNNKGNNNSLFFTNGYIVSHINANQLKLGQTLLHLPTNQIIALNQVFNKNQQYKLVNTNDSVFSCLIKEVNFFDQSWKLLSLQSKDYFHVDNCSTIRLTNYVKGEFNEVKSVIFSVIYTNKSSHNVKYSNTINNNYDINNTRETMNNVNDIILNRDNINEGVVSIQDTPNVMNILLLLPDPLSSPPTSSTSSSSSTRSLSIALGVITSLFLLLLIFLCVLAYCCYCRRDKERSYASKYENGNLPYSNGLTNHVLRLNNINTNNNNINNNKSHTNINTNNNNNNKFTEDLCYESDSSSKTNSSTKVLVVKKTHNNLSNVINPSTHNPFYNNKNITTNINSNNNINHENNSVNSCNNVENSYNNNNNNINNNNTKRLHVFKLVHDSTYDSKRFVNKNNNNNIINIDNNNPATDHLKMKLNHNISINESISKNGVEEDEDVDDDADGADDDANNNGNIIENSSVSNSINFNSQVINSQSKDHKHEKVDETNNIKNSINNSFHYHKHLGWIKHRKPHYQSAQNQNKKFKNKNNRGFINSCFAGLENGINNVCVSLRAENLVTDIENYPNNNINTTNFIKSNTSFNDSTTKCTNNNKLNTKPSSNSQFNNKKYNPINNSNNNLNNNLNNNIVNGQPVFSFYQSDSAIGSMGGLCDRAGTLTESFSTDSNVLSMKSFKIMTQEESFDSLSNYHKTRMNGEGEGKKKIEGLSEVGKIDVVGGGGDENRIEDRNIIMNKTEAILTLPELSNVSSIKIDNEKKKNGKVVFNKYNKISINNFNDHKKLQEIQHTQRQHHQANLQPDNTKEVIYSMVSKQNKSHDNEHVPMQNKVKTTHSNTSIDLTVQTNVEGDNKAKGHLNSFLNNKNRSEHLFSIDGNHKKNVDDVFNLKNTKQQKCTNDNKKTFHSSIPVINKTINDIIHVPDYSHNNFNNNIKKNNITNNNVTKTISNNINTNNNNSTINNNNINTNNSNSNTNMNNSNTNKINSNTNNNNISNNSSYIQDDGYQETFYI